jgi:crotonyl-CoA reductase
MTVIDLPEIAKIAIEGGSAADLLAAPIPSHYLAAHLRQDDFGNNRKDKDVRNSIHIGPVPMPELAPDEVLIAVMASSINHNTVWSAIGEPINPFVFLHQMGKKDRWAARHDLPTQVIGSDAAGIIIRTGTAVTGWLAGDHVVVHPAVVDTQDHAVQNDSLLASDIRAWGFETNFGGLAHFCVAKANQLLHKPSHLTWEEAAVNTLCLSTAYRMLVGNHGAQMRQGDIVLIWGAAGGLGLYALQLVRNGGGIAVGIVGSDRKADLLRKFGCDVVINRHETAGADRPDTMAKSIGYAIRKSLGEDPHIVFEHTGRETFGASVFLARRGGAVVTCGSSSGFMHEFDNRYLWMRVKRIIGSHGANYQEAWEANRLISLGRLIPTMSCVYPLAESGEAARMVQLNEHVGKIGVLALAPKEGLGVQDWETRYRVGEDRLRIFRNDADITCPPY